MAKRLLPSLNRVLVEKLVQPKKTAGGILLPETSKQLNAAKVVAVGPGERDKAGNLIPVALKEGDTVLLPEYGGSEVKLAADKDCNCTSKCSAFTTKRKGLALQLPDEVPDKNEIIRLRKVASSVGVGDKHDAEWVHSILTDAGAANDNSWILLPYLCAAFMVSNIWNGAVYDVNIGGLSNNLHCLARCVSAVIEGSEYTRVEREQRINSLSNVHTDELQEAELPSRVSAEANIKSSMQIYVKLSAGVVLDSWNDTSRYLVHCIFRIRVWQRFPTTPRSHTFEPGYYSSSGSQHDDGYDADRRAGRLLRSTRRSGPLDFGASRKAKKFVEGSSSGSSHGAGSLQRFAVSRSGPLSYK
ncbi:putative protein NAP1 [Zea mays]|uniref:Chaperonin n=1 Tax=Zea mays TaxID=4577 RepID=A0A3L6EB27_MAIZE|nr:putative protein NAP1 [Zea mays]